MEKKSGRVVKGGRMGLECAKEEMGKGITSYYEKESKIVKIMFVNKFWISLSPQEAMQLASQITQVAEYGLRELERGSNEPQSENHASASE